MRIDARHISISDVKTRHNLRAGAEKMSRHAMLLECVWLRDVAVMRYCEGMRAHEIAAKISRSPEWVSKRIHKIDRVLTSREFALMVEHTGSLLPELREAGQALFVRLLTMREAAVALGIPLHKLRDRRTKLLSLAEMAYPRNRQSIGQGFRSKPYRGLNQ